MVGITGSCGKSSTANILDHVLRGAAKVHCGIGRNADGGVADSLLRAPRDARFLVQEVSGEEPGAMDRRLALLKPQVAVVLTVGLDHRKSFRTEEAVAQEKGKLVACLPADGVAVLNADDPNVVGMARRASSRVVTFGAAPESDYRMTGVDFAWPRRLSLDVEVKGERHRIETPLVGKHFAHNVLAAFVAAVETGVPVAQCIERLKTAPTVYQRLSVHRHPSGAIMIADTFKAPFWGVGTSLAVLEQAEAPRRTVILGGMSDTYGSDRQRYSQTGQAALEVADRVVFFGEKSARARRFAAAQEEGKVILLPDVKDLVSWMDKNLMADEVVLLKSSARHHLERAFLVPRIGQFCDLQFCDRSASCLKCKRTKGWDTGKDPLDGARMV